MNTNSQSNTDALRIGRPGSSFVLDHDFYIDTWEDVRLSGVDPLIHYEQYGRDERRQCCEAQMLSDIAAVELSGVLILAAQRGDADGRNARTRLIEQMMSKAAMRGFEADFINKYYPRTILEGEHPFAFYCRHARHPWCFANIYEAEPQLSVLRDSKYLDKTYLSAQMGPVLGQLDPVLYYATEGFRARLDPSYAFSTRDYVLNNPDVGKILVNPLVHFEEYGFKENRLHSARATADIRPGAKVPRADRPVLIICSNEAGRSGAPLVGLNIARQLSDDFDIVSIFSRSGPLLQSFIEVSTIVAVCGDSESGGRSLVDELCARRPVYAAILNSIEGARIVGALNAHGVPTVSLVHEFAQYVSPFNMMAQTFVMSDRVVFPAQIVLAAARRELAQLRFDPQGPRNLEVRPQGRSLLPPVTPVPLYSLKALTKRSDQVLTVIGAGHVQPRKGVDLFIETARVLVHELGINAKFVWVGPAYAPHADVLVSIYLADQIRASKLENVVTFVPEMQDLKPIWDSADVFFMSSRLDPFPNVALDALAEGLTVVCFDQATGIAELAERLRDRVLAVPYNDTRSAANAIVSARQTGRQPPSPELEGLLSFADYAADLAGFIHEAVKRRPILVSVTGEMRSAQVDPIMLYRTLPRWPRLLELCGTVDGLMQATSRAALNGLTLGRLRAGRFSALNDAEVAAASSGQADGVWARDDYTIATSVNDGHPVKVTSVILITDSNLDVLNLARIAFSGLGPELGRFAVISSDLVEFDISPLKVMVGEGRVMLVRSGARAGTGVASFMSGESCLLIVPSPLRTGWEAAAERLVAVDGDAPVQFAACDDLSDWKVELEAELVITHPYGLERRLINEDVCRLSVAEPDLADVLHAICAPLTGRQSSLWNALVQTPALLAQGWSLSDRHRHAQVLGYDLLVGREPILMD